MAADGWGIEDGWLGVDGRWHATPPDTRRALRAAMGGERGDPDPPPHRPVWIVRPGAAEPLPDPCTLVLEDGTDLGTITRLPADLPVGYHLLSPVGAWPDRHLVVSPGRCHLPAGLRAWGVTVQVPAARSRSSWGIGDLADVGALAGWLRGLGGDLLALSPLHAPLPVGPVDPSPYFPSSRRWHNPMLLRIDEVPGAAGDPAVGALAARARALLADPRIDRDAVWSLQRDALARLWRTAGPAPELHAWRERQGVALERYATHCALAERHGRLWPEWPDEHRHPESPAVADAATSLADRISFHAWLQWLVAGQLSRAAGAGAGLLLDLAVGVDPRGADAWALQDVLALDARVGAPPDAFAPGGQDWGVPPFVPWKLRDVGYRPLAELLRAAMSVGVGLRVDHVMGLSRLFWIPPGGAPTDGTYVRFPVRELLEVVAVESSRAGALVVGEDLGTVEPGFRDELAATGILSTRLVWFEDAPPESFPEQALAAVTTHDLPTLAGAWTGADEAELAALGRPAAARAAEALRSRLAELTGAPPGAGSSEVAIAVHRRLGATPSAAAVATIEDALGVTRRPNVPGTTAERPNWSIALPVPLEELARHPLATAVLGALAAGRTAARPVSTPDEPDRGR